MDERILIPLDGSEVGESALKHVEMFISKLSPKVKVEITLLHVIKPTPVYIAGDYIAAVPVVPSQEANKESERRAMGYLHSVGERLRHKNVIVLSKVAIGNPAEEIAQTANDINADIIAMSTHGRSGFSKWAFGSVTDRVLRTRGTKPVLLIRVQG